MTHCVCMEAHFCITMNLILFKWTIFVISYIWKYRELSKKDSIVVFPLCGSWVLIIIFSKASLSVSRPVSGWIGMWTNKILEFMAISIQWDLWEFTALYKVTIWVDLSHHVSFLFTCHTAHAKSNILHVWFVAKGILNEVYVHWSLRPCNLTNTSPVRSKRVHCIIKSYHLSGFMDNWHHPTIFIFFLRTTQHMPCLIFCKNDLTWRWCSLIT